MWWEDAGVGDRLWGKEPLGWGKVRANVREGTTARQEGSPDRASRGEVCERRGDKDGKEPRRKCFFTI